jgi:hypothetical protein
MFMITSKKLIAWWIGLGIAAALGGKAHDVLEQEARNISAQEKPYVELTDAQAIRWGYEQCKQSTARQEGLAQSGYTCERLYSNPIPEIVSSARYDHRRAHSIEEYDRLRPKITRLDDNLELFYGAVGLGACAVFLLWCRSTLLPLLTRLKETVRERTPSPSELKALGANRKVRQAESDFVTLKNLHDNGLINDEMFEKRKDELKVALSANHVFRDLDGGVERQTTAQ